MSNEIMDLRERCREGRFLSDEPSVESGLTMPPETPIPPAALMKLSVRSRNVLQGMFKNPTVGNLCGLDDESIGRRKGAGKLVTAELLLLRRKFLAGEIDVRRLVDDEPGASSYSSMAEMLVALEGSGNVRTGYVMRLHMGLLNVCDRRTMDVCGQKLGVSRARIQQIDAKVRKRLFTFPRRKPLAELDTLVREAFAAAPGFEILPEALISMIESAFGWTDTTTFSLLRLLTYLGLKIEVLPEGRGWGWNEDGRFDWVADYVPPTMTEKRRAAIKQVLTDAGYEGLTLDDILAACSRDYPDLKIREGNVRGAMNGSLDDDGTRIIPYDRGTRLNGGTRYSLNTFFHDEATKAVLEKAAVRIRSYMEKTGLGVVSVWKASREYQTELPRPLPKLGFYLMMRDFGSGGLSYSEYPRIAYPGVKVVEDTFPWLMYQYFTYCGHKTASFAEIHYFFTECLGLQPSVAMACTIASMGLKKVNDDFRSPYVIRPPAEGVKPPVLFLPSIAQYRDFSLIKVPAKTSINAYYLDENGRAITHGAYAKLFFRALEENGFAFPAAELAGLLDKGWCKIHLNAYRAVLRPTHGQTSCPVYGYWRERFVFGGEEYFVSDDWEVRNKSHFDRWAIRIASLADIPFEPYDVPGLALDD